jgi:hypothetical protein
MESNLTEIRMILFARKEEAMVLCAPFMSEEEAPTWLQGTEVEAKMELVLAMAVVGTYFTPHIVPRSRG